MSAEAEGREPTAAVPRPTSWEVECPICKAVHDAVLDDPFVAGVYHPEDEDTYLLCDCGELLEITGVVIERESTYATSVPTEDRRGTDASTSGAAGEEPA